MAEQCPLISGVKYGDSTDLPSVCLEQCQPTYERISSTTPGIEDDYGIKECTDPIELSAEIISVVSLSRRRYTIVDQCMPTKAYEHPHQTGETSWVFDCPYGAE